MARQAGSAEERPDFASVLLERAEAEDLRKVERTRLKLMAAVAAELLAGTERNALKVARVTEKAGLAHGTFYRYFSDMGAALEALVGEFSAFIQERLAGARQGAPGSAERAHAATLLYTRLFAANAGLMRCLIGLGNENSAFAAAYRELNRAWYRRMAAAMARERGGGKDEEAFLPAAYALGGMVDEFLAQLYLRREPALAALAEDEAAVAALLTELWRRGAYGRLDDETG